MTTARPESATGTLWFVHWLRAFSVSVVVLLHLWITLWANDDVSSAFAHVGQLPHATDVPWAFLFTQLPTAVGIGYVAVGFFFLISGFLIPLTMEGRSPGRFLVVRIFRVYPVWAVSTGLFAAFFALQSWRKSTPIGLSVEDWVTNLLVVPDLTGAVLINPVGWTLMVEVKFYLLCALLARTNALHRPVWVCLIVILWTAYAVAVWGNLEGLHRVHGDIWIATQALASDARHMCAIFAGVSLYNRLQNGWTLSQTTATLAVCTAAMTVSALFIERDAGYALPKFAGYVVALVLFTIAFAQRSRFPHSRAAAYAADVSYSVYVIHFIAGVVAAHVLLRLGVDPTSTVIVTILMILAVSVLMHRWVEAPGNRYGKRVRWPLTGRAARDPDQATS